MGEYAEMALNGDLCEGCGEWMGEGDGFARRCRSCKGTERPRIVTRRRPGLTTDARLQQLTEMGATVDVKNDGLHWIIRKGEKRIDFWPTKESFKVNLAGYKQHGFTQLLDHLKPEALNG